MRHAERCGHESKPRLARRGIGRPVLLPDRREERCAQVHPGRRRGGMHSRRDLGYRGAPSCDGKRRYGSLRQGHEEGAAGPRGVVSQRDRRHGHRSDGKRRQDHHKGYADSDLLTEVQDQRDKGKLQQRYRPSADGALPRRGD